MHGGFEIILRPSVGGMGSLHRKENRVAVAQCSITLIMPVTFKPGRWVDGVWQKFLRLCRRTGATSPQQ